MVFIKLIALLVCATVVLGRPRYIAIPLDALGNVGNVRLVAQPIYQNPIYAQARSFQYEPQGAESSVQGDYLPSPSRLVADEDRSKRESGGHGDHVDYGAYTGSHGAFGWYTDHPVGGHH